MFASGPKSGVNHSPNCVLLSDRRSACVGLTVPAAPSQNVCVNGPGPGGSEKSAPPLRQPAGASGCVTLGVSNVGLGQKFPGMGSAYTRAVPSRLTAHTAKPRVDTRCHLVAIFLSPPP